MARTKLTPETKFYVKTTNDESLSNSKFGEDYGNEDPIMDYKRQTLKFKIEMAKREIYLWEQQICEINREINATKKNSTGNEGRCGVDNSDSDMDVKKTNT